MLTWTFQSKDFLKDLGNQYTLQDSRYADLREFMSAYHWLIRVMGRKGLHQPHADAAPMWLFARWEHVRHIGIATIRSNPDFDWARNLSLYVVRIPESRVLLTDFDDRHAVLNRCQLGDDDACTPESTWDHVIIHHAKDMRYHRCVQATTWRLRADDIVGID